MSDKVVVVDYGVGNLLSVTRAFRSLGAEVVVANAPHAVARADRLVVPGVGAFGEGMAGLAERGLVEAIKEFAQKERPFLGICLGMQVMLEASAEFGAHEGVALVPGLVVSVPSIGRDGRPHKIPHIGWNGLEPVQGMGWEGTILAGLKPGDAVYFVHSYMAVPARPDHWLAVSDYDGQTICAALRVGSIYGCQFHPERSGPVGLQILANFASL